MTYFGKRTQSEFRLLGRRQMETPDPDFLQKLKDDVAEIDAYCQHTDCIGREIRIYTKEHDPDSMPLALYCPLCREKLKIQDVLTLKQSAERSLRVAALLVAAHRLRRQKGLHTIAEEF